MTIVAANLRDVMVCRTYVYSKYACSETAECPAKAA